MADEYISREAVGEQFHKLIVAFYSAYAKDGKDERLAALLELGVAARSAINAIPSADVIEVVRCKDCVWSQNRWQPQSAPEGWHYCADIDIPTPKDFYCAFGEKRQESGGEGDE